MASLLKYRLHYIMLTVVLADTVLFCWGSNWGPSALTVQVLQPVVLFRASQLGVTGQPLAIISLVSSVTLITGESQFFLAEFQTLLIIYIFLAVHAWDQSDWIILFPCAWSLIRGYTAAEQHPSLFQPRALKPETRPTSSLPVPAACSRRVPLLFIPDLFLTSN